MSSNPSIKVGALIRLYIDIALWRRGPQDVPMAAPVLPATALAYLLISVVAGWLANNVMPLAATAAHQAGAAMLAADVLFVCGWYWWLLRIFGRGERYRQTLTAVFGCAAVLTLPSIMVVQLLLYSSSDKASGLAAAASLATLIMVVWGVMAQAHILKSALERTLIYCVSLVILLQVSEWLLTGLLPGT